MLRFLVRWRATVHGELEVEAEDEDEACQRAEAEVTYNDLWAKNTRDLDLHLSTGNADMMVSTRSLTPTPGQRRRQIHLVKPEKLT